MGGPVGPYVQTERRELYRKYAELLVEKGAAYRCFCSEERLQSLHQEDPNAKYDRHCLHLSPEEVQKKLEAGEPYVIRQKIPKAPPPSTMRCTGTLRWTTASWTIRYC